MDREIADLMIEKLTIERDRLIGLIKMFVDANNSNLLSLQKIAMEHAEILLEKKGKNKWK